MTNDRTTTGLPFPSPETLHDRARAAAVELRQLLITLATACLAVYFVTVTGEHAANLSFSQRTAARAGLLCMGLSVFAGVVAAFSDARRNYTLACYVQVRKTEKPEVSEDFRRSYERYYGLLQVSHWTQRLGFLAGIGASIVYTMTFLSR